MKVFFSIFFACYSIFFAVGFAKGRNEASSQSSADYLADRVMKDTVNGRLFLVYVDGLNKPTRYSVDDNKIVEYADWVSELKGKYATDADGKSPAMTGGVVVYGTAAVLSNYKDVIKFCQKKSPNRGQGLIAAVLGAIAGYMSGEEIGKSSYTPDEQTIPNARMLADTAFWKQAELSLYTQWAEELKHGITMYAVSNPEYAASAIASRKAVETNKDETVNAHSVADTSFTTSDFDKLTGISGLPAAIALHPQIEEESVDWTAIFKWIGLVLFSIGAFVVLSQIFKFVSKSFSPPPKKKKKVKAADEKEMD
jgi:hypothetical protein